MGFVFEILQPKNGRLELFLEPSTEAAHKLAKHFASYVPVHLITIETKDGSIFRALVWRHPGYRDSRRLIATGTGRLRQSDSKLIVTDWGYPPGSTSGKIIVMFDHPSETRMHAYIELAALVERLHRQFLEVVTLELDSCGIHDINSVQGLMLFNIGDAEMTVSELTLRGCYLGSNVSYNVKKMVENGYLAHERSVHDRRSMLVRLTEKGAKLRDRLQQMHQRHVEMLERTAITEKDLHTATVTLGRLDRFWTRVQDIKPAAA